MTALNCYITRSHGHFARGYIRRVEFAGRRQPNSCQTKDPSFANRDIDDIFVM